MPSLPKFSEWLNDKSLFWQANFGYTMKMLPIFIVLYGYVICKNILLLSTEASLLIPSLFGMMLFLLWMNYDMNNRSVAATKLPINLSIRWSKTKIPDEINIIKAHDVIKEDYVKGEFSYVAELEHPIKDVLNREDFRHIVFLSSYNWDKTMQKIDDCFVSYNGSVFMGSAAKLIVDWAHDFKNVAKDDEGTYDFVPFRVFKVRWCPEDGDSYQKAIGVISSDGDIDKIKEAANIVDANNSAKTLMELRDERSINKEMAGKVKSSGEKLIEWTGTLIDNDRFIRKPNTTINWRSTKVRLLLLLGCFALGVLVYWYFYVRPGVH